MEQMWGGSCERFKEAQVLEAEQDCAHKPNFSKVINVLRPRIFLTSFYPLARVRW